MVLSFANVEKISSSYSFEKLSFKGSLFKESVEASLVPEILLKTVIPGYFVESKPEVYTYHEKSSCMSNSFSLSLRKHDLTFEEVQFFNIETCRHCLNFKEPSTLFHLILALQDLLIFKNKINKIMSFDAFNPFNVNLLTLPDVTESINSNETVLHRYGSLLTLQVSYLAFVFYQAKDVIKDDIISFALEEVKKVFTEMFTIYNFLLKDHESFLQTNVYKKHIEALTKKHFKLTESFVLTESKLSLVSINDEYRLGYIIEDVDKVLNKFSVYSLSFLMKKFLTSFDALDYYAPYGDAHGSMTFKEETHRMFLIKVILSTYQVSDNNKSIFFVMPLEIKNFLLYLNSKFDFRNELYPLLLNSCEIEEVKEDVLETFTVLASDAKAHSDKKLKTLWETASLL